MIAESHLSKINTYNVQIGGVDVKTRVVDDTKLVPAALAELGVGGVGDGGAHPIVGVDVKVSSNLFGRGKRCDLLILCTRSNCLILRLDPMRFCLDSDSQTVTDFLSFKDVSFVCPNGFRKRTRGLPLFVYANHTITTYGRFRKTTRNASFDCSEIGAVEVGYYAARALRNPKLLKCESFSKLGKEAGVDLTTGNSDNGKMVKRRPKWDAEVFSDEEVLSVMHDAAACYRIVHKLLQSP
ncbi:unnamed protein product [Cuscuta epithymum]|uniref:Uncharacterized protein n=1 Tax=Cuscuta epithymum TaxID=186058 RepID=A0AAV0CNZ7_9ASTE|nr:unnamed protein product [Cuscuta epithymum]